MTHPIEPNLDPSAPPVASPRGQASEEDEIRQLARALAPPDVTAMSGHKAVVEAVSLGNATTAPTVTVNLGGISVANVRLASNYSPVVGDTVVLIRQGASYVAAFRIAEAGSKSDQEEAGWITASLASGNSAYSGSTVAYRRVLDHGAWKMQWKGLVAYGNSSLLASALASEYRPSESRPVSIARSITGGLPVMRIDFDTDGTATFWGAAFSLPSGGVSNHTHGGSTGFAGDSHTHSHGGAVPETSFGSTHSHSIPSSDLSHSHSVTNPPWVSLNGVEYFL